MGNRTDSPAWSLGFRRMKVRRLQSVHYRFADQYESEISFNDRDSQFEMVFETLFPDPTPLPNITRDREAELPESQFDELVFPRIGIFRFELRAHSDQVDGFPIVKPTHNIQGL